MKMLLTAIVLLVAATAARGQDIKHAPSVEQCRADWRLWNAQDPQPKAFSALQIWEIGARAEEMQNCASVDPAWESHYWNQGAEFQIEVSIRQRRYLERHGLMAQFLMEDTEGAR